MLLNWQLQYLCVASDYDIPNPITFDNLSPVSLSFYFFCSLHSHQPATFTQMAYLLITLS